MRDELFELAEQQYKSFKRRVSCSDFGRFPMTLGDVNAIVYVAHGRIKEIEVSFPNGFTGLLRPE